MKIEEVDFSTIKDVWSDKDYWAKRQNIQPVNCNLYWDGVNHLGGENLDLLDQEISKPIFLAAKMDDGEIAGVISGFLSAPGQWRLRGLYVRKEYRDLKVARKLLRRILRMGYNRHQAQFAWAIPRGSALGVWTRVGFVATSPTYHDELPDGNKIGDPSGGCYVRLDYTEEMVVKLARRPNNHKPIRTPKRKRGKK